MPIVPKVFFTKSWKAQHELSRSDGLRDAGIEKFSLVSVSAYCRLDARSSPRMMGSRNSILDRFCSS
jgi:hypothetical protein